jgi:hypothetical protein
MMADCGRGSPTTTYEIIGVAGILITFTIIGVTAWLVVRSMK